MTFGGVSTTVSTLRVGSLTWYICLSFYCCELSVSVAVDCDMLMI